MPPLPTRALHMEDQVFLLYATELDRTQVRLGELAAEKAQDEQVRQFAQRMIDYHTQSNVRLMQIAQQFGVEIPQETSPIAQRMQDELQGLTGPLFDYEYMTSQVIYDYSAHYFYKREEHHGLVRRLQPEAEQQAEQLREHRREAQRIARRLQARPVGLDLEDSSFLLTSISRRSSCVLGANNLTPVLLLELSGVPMPHLILRVGPAHKPVCGTACPPMHPTDAIEIDGLKRSDAIDGRSA
jgi:predicted outer membrane protein